MDDRSAVWELLGGTKAGAVFQNFRLQLPPGEYAISKLDVRAKGLSRQAFALPAAGWRFMVPADNCVYVGRINTVLVRLPAASLDRATAQTSEMSASAGRPLLMIYLVEGALVLTA